MTQSGLDRVLLAAAPAAQFNTEVVRSAWRALAERRRAAMRDAYQALKVAGQSSLSYEKDMSEDPMSYSYIKQLWTDHIIVEVGDDNTLYSVPFTVSAPGTSIANVEFGAPTRVVETYVAAAQRMDMDSIHLSADELGLSWVSQSPVVTLAGPPVAERKRLASKGAALADGSYPIPNVAYLKKAIQALGRAKDRASALSHIKKRARELGQPQLAAHLK